MRLIVGQAFFFQAEDGIRDYKVTGVQTCALPICWNAANPLVQQLVRETPAWRAARKRADGQGKDKATDKDSEEDTLKALLADKAFMKQLREDKTRVQAGFVALNPATSEVLAWVGSRDFTQDARSEER